jgi:hypothetical protein
MPLAPKSRKYYSLPLSLRAADYFDQHAASRNIMPGRLLTRLLETIAEDNMLSSVLDDDGKFERSPLERAHRVSHQRKRIL